MQDYQRRALAERARTPKNRSQTGLLGHFVIGAIVAAAVAGLVAIGLHDLLVQINDAVGQFGGQQ